MELLLDDQRLTVVRDIGKIVNRWLRECIKEMLSCIESRLVLESRLVF